MRTMGRVVWTVVVAGTALVLMAPAGIAGQSRAGGGPSGRDGKMRGPPRGPGLERMVDLATANRADLGLTEDQVQELQFLLREFDEVSSQADLAREEAREKLRSGELDREEMRSLRSEESEALRGLAEGFHHRIQGILTQPQQDQLTGIMIRSGRGGAGGRPAGRGPGARSKRGGFRGGGPNPGLASAGHCGRPPWAVSYPGS
jgi:Spy/CpxP family protein refolding chaperone